MLLDRRLVVIDGRHSHVTEPPPSLGDGDLVFNAPRGLYGNPTFQGEFVCGRHYAIVPAHDPQRAWCIQENKLLGAVLLAYITEEEAQEQLREFFRNSPTLAHVLVHYAEYPDRWRVNWHSSWWSHCSWDRVEITL